MKPARAKRWLTAAAAVGLALPALAQDRPESILPPGFGNDTALPTPATPTPSPSPSPSPSGTSPTAGTATPLEGEVVSEDVAEEELAPAPPQIELPPSARRDPFRVGNVDSAAAGLGAEPWGSASGAFLSALLRRVDTPLASRWMHIALRNAVGARSAAPRAVNPVDWTAERAWLLLRMGEADAARMLVAGIDVDRFTPKMFQVGVQSALATADPAALCPLIDGMRRVERRIVPLSEAICAALSGEPERAAAAIESARRSGSIGGIDLALADKLVGAGADTARAVTIEWEPVDRLTAWRYGIATATGIAPPDRLLADASPQLRAWQARAPLLSAEQRLASARIATGLGILSAAALTDVYAAIYDSTDADELGSSDAWALRTAFVGRDQAARLGAMRKLWSIGQGSLEREASRALLALAATRIIPDPSLQAEAPDLIASMLSAGYDRHAARWAGAIRRMDDGPADRCWAMLALSARAGTVDVGFSRIDGFAGRDDSPGRHRTALLVAGLAGLGRIDARTAARLDSRYDLGIDRPTRWTRMIDGAANRGQAGTAALLAAAGMQTADFSDVPASHLLHIVAAMRQTGQEFTARMIAAEALARS